MLFMLWAFTGFGDRQAHGTKTVPRLNGYRASRHHSLSQGPRPRPLRLFVRLDGADLLKVWINCTACTQAVEHLETNRSTICEAHPASRVSYHKSPRLSALQPYLSQSSPYSLYRGFGPDLRKSLGARMSIRELLFHPFDTPFPKASGWPQHDLCAVGSSLICGTIRADRSSRLARGSVSPQGTCDGSAPRVHHNTAGPT